MNRREFLETSIKTCAACALGLYGGFFCSSSVFARTRIDTGEYTPAEWFETLSDGKVKCTLCPLEEKLEPGKWGACRVRLAKDGRLWTANYGKPAALHLDPIEKNPIYHFKPGLKTLAIATAGCNLACPACQNWEMSQTEVGMIKYYDMPPKKTVYHAQKNHCGGITYTFTEPVIFFEYLMDTAKEASSLNLSNHIVSGGYVNNAPLNKLCDMGDSFSISIKGKQDSAYGDRPQVFETIKKTLTTIKNRGRWLEAAVLVTPGINDTMEFFREISKWIKENLGEYTPVHFSRFFPSFKLKNIPQTPVSLLERGRKTAMEEGLKYVYVGNVPGHQYNNTFCHKCGKMLIQRVGFRVLKNNLDKGCCRFCGTSIPGIW